MVRVHVFNQQGQLVGPVESPHVEHTDSEWKELLSPEQFQVLRAKGTERPFCGTLLDNKKQGVYTCVGCGLPLFSSEAKFNSGTGWPSFFQALPGAALETPDTSLGLTRATLRCRGGGGHLGHVLRDGPLPTGLCSCIT